MGLDMYLMKKTTLCGEYAKKKDKEKKVFINFTDRLNEENKFEFKIKEISAIETQVGYWRKAYCIGKWFEENKRNDGFIRIEKLITLRDICYNILQQKNKNRQEELAQNLLPTEESENNYMRVIDIVDANYLKDLKTTIKIIDKIKKQKDYMNRDYFYLSSN